MSTEYLIDSIDEFVKIWPSGDTNESFVRKNFLFSIWFCKSIVYYEFFIEVLHHQHAKDRFLSVLINRFYNIPEYECKDLHNAMSSREAWRDQVSMVRVIIPIWCFWRWINKLYYLTHLIHKWKHKYYLVFLTYSLNIFWYLIPTCYLQKLLFFLCEILLLMCSFLLSHRWKIVRF